MDRSSDEGEGSTLSSGRLAIAQEPLAAQAPLLKVLGPQGKLWFTQIRRDICNPNQPKTLPRNSLKI